jgi:GH25 family lysozyme M1 (1,4-beta-N-acetylmuramidase)
MSELKVAATCGAAGYTLHYCECGYSYRSSHTPPLEHSLSAVEHPASCTEQGYVSYDCENCDYEFNSDFREPLGHNFTSSSARPTATRAGYTDYTCECGYSYRGDYIYYSDILESAYVENQTVLARGIDVSRWNHQIDAASGEYLPLDWKAVKRAGFEFVILKAGSTKSGLEPTFVMDYEGARAAGLEVGAYFYTYSNTIEGISNDADMLLSFLEGKQFEYPIYLDLEDPSLSALGKNYLSRMCTTFLETLQRNGYYAGLYTNHTWLTTLLDTARMVSLFDIWYARYPGTEAPTWNEEKYGKQLGMWQYTQSGSIEGIEGEFDLNYSYKNYSSIMKKWGLNGYGK